MSELGGIAEAARARHRGPELLLHLFWEAHEERGEEEAGRNGVDPDAFLGEVTRERKRHPDDRSLRRGVCHLAALPIERRDARGVDDDTALPVLVSVVRCDSLRGETSDVEGLRAKGEMWWDGVCAMWRCERRGGIAPQEGGERERERERE